jgi:phosphoribosyl-AMP cyclohydrolase
MDKNATSTVAVENARKADADKTATKADAVENAPTADAENRATQADAVVSAISFGPNGLVAAIAQQHDSGEVLMMAWMNETAVRETIATRRVCYFSRSRGTLWRKGETSGQVQALVDLRVDCDGDTLLLLVDQTGVACHTGRRSCFFQGWRDGALRATSDVQVAPETLYGAGHSGHGHSGHGDSGHG